MQCLLSASEANERSASCPVLTACATRGELVSEAPYEADGHLKGRNIDDAVRRSRKRRQANLQTKPADVRRALALSLAKS